MAAAPHDGAPPHPDETDAAADGRPFGVPAFYAELAERLLDDGYEPLPLERGQKWPVVSAWPTIAIDEAQVTAWVAEHPDCGLGLRTGALVGVDLDVEDQDLAHAAAVLTQEMLGRTIQRVGRWPRRLLLYRTATPFPKLSIPSVEILAKGQQLAAFGIHPITRRAYAWPDGSPCDTPFDQLPLIDETRIHALLGGLAQILPGGENAGGGGRRRAGAGGGWTGPTRDADGRVLDGRDAHLSGIVFHVLHDALDRGAALDHAGLVDAAWARFVETSDVVRPKGGGARPYDRSDAARKLDDKLRLLAEGRLRPRTRTPVAPPPEIDRLPVPEARAALEATIRAACDRVLDWHVGPLPGDPPQIGVRATVGLGKSVVTRRALLDLRQALGRAGAPFRIVVATPSHALAEETAEAFRRADASVAVLRGHERKHPRSGRPMCRDVAAVNAALATGLSPQTAICADEAGRRCRFFDGCPKQANRAEVAGAEVVVAPYDALFGGLPMRKDEIALIVIDEGCWPRALDETTRLDLGALVAPVAGDAELRGLRAHAGAALAACVEGPVARSALAAVELTAAEAERAADLEAGRMDDPGFAPGQPPAARATALRQAALNADALARAAIWRAMARLLAGELETDGRLRVEPADIEGGPVVAVLGVKPLHPALTGRPVLHLDATLRPELARTILPRLETTTIEADTPHARLRLVAGPFGKRRICPTGAFGAAERMRRQNRLEEAATYVRWHAARFPGRRTLVVTYADCERAFAEIPGVETAHFNAVAGLDAWRDVALLVVVGRPLPPEAEVRRRAAAFFGVEPAGCYAPTLQGVLLRDGGTAAVRVYRHEDAFAETIRAAICDDELIQAIGRARAVNRGPADPVEIHVLADVALPLVHDRVLAWAVEAPTVLQRMLLAGLAVDSPGDATALHPGLFGNPEQAEKAFERAGFTRHSPLRTSMWEMSVKSARYRRGGRGRGWQRAYWIAGDADMAKAALERAVGPLAEWTPE